jgi:hypothetical protein
MITLIDHLRALLGANSLATEIALLTAADARASRLPRKHGVLYSDAVYDAIDELTHPGPVFPGDGDVRIHPRLRAHYPILRFALE